MADGNRELGDGGHAFAAQRDRRVERHLVGTGNRQQRALAGALHPGDQLAVIEPQRQVAAQPDLATAPVASRMMWEGPERSGMKSVSVTSPVSVAKVVSRISVSGR